MYNSCFILNANIQNKLFVFCLWHADTKYLTTWWLLFSYRSRLPTLNPCPRKKSPTYGFFPIKWRKLVENHLVFRNIEDEFRVRATCTQVCAVGSHCPALGLTKPKRASCLNSNCRSLDGHYQLDGVCEVILTASLF